MQLVLVSILLLVSY